MKCNLLIGYLGRLTIVLGCQILIYAGELTGQFNGELNWVLANDHTTHENTSVKSADFSVFTCGVNVDHINIISSILVLGKENGEEAIDLGEWVIPIEPLMKALKINIKTLNNGDLEVRGKSILTQIPASKLTIHPELGRGIKLKDLESIIGIKSEFDITEYAIKLTLPKSNTDDQRKELETPLDLDGLTWKKPPQLSLTAFSNESRLSSTNIPSRWQTAGTLFDGAWYATFDSNNQLGNVNLREVQWLKQTATFDTIVGSHPLFWRQQNNGNYWGMTNVWRSNFTAPKGDINPNNRLRSSRLLRSIVDSTEPGTLVRLVTIDQRIVAETLVDSSGVFRFEDIPIGQTDGNKYRLLLYPQGQLFRSPIIKDINFMSISGQIPHGESATIASWGWLRPNGVGSNLQDFRAGVGQYIGVSEELTLGLGLGYEQSLQTFGQLHWQPNQIPLQVSLGGTTGNNQEWIGNIYWRPSREFDITGNMDPLGSRVRSNWRINANLNLGANYDSNRGFILSTNYGIINKDFQTRINASINSNSQLNWIVNHRWQQLEFNQQGNETGYLTLLNYHLIPNWRGNPRNYLELSHQQQSQGKNQQLSSVSWRYLSPDLLLDGSPSWETQVGYGVGSQGSGWLLSGTFNLLPGIKVRTSYQGVDLSGTRSDFRLELLTSLQTQGGLQQYQGGVDQLRIQGGIIIQPFFDHNGNGQRDPGENTYLDLELLNFNRRPLKIYRPQINNEQIQLNLPPGNYRLDFDPAGFPMDWRTLDDGYAVQIVSGSYTEIPVPLIQAYEINGVISDREGKPIGGAKVQAISTDGKEVISITNYAGEYYLESVPSGVYRLLVNGKPVQPSTIKLDRSTPSSQTLNLTVEN